MREFFIELLDIFKAMPAALFDILCILFPFLGVFRDD